MKCGSGVWHITCDSPKYWIAVLVSQRVTPQFQTGAATCNHSCDYHTNSWAWTHNHTGSNQSNVNYPDAWLSPFHAGNQTGWRHALVEMDRLRTRAWFSNKRSNGFTTCRQVAFIKLISILHQSNLNIPPPKRPITVIDLKFKYRSTTWGDVKSTTEKYFFQVTAVLNYGCVNFLSTTCSRALCPFLPCFLLVLNLLPLRHLQLFSSTG